MRKRMLLMLAVAAIFVVAIGLCEVLPDPRRDRAGSAC